MFSAPRNNRCCATCKNWAGVRKKTCYGVEAPSGVERGKCLAGVYTSATSGHCAYEGTDCKKFEKWSEI